MYFNADIFAINDLDQAAELSMYPGNVVLAFVDHPKQYFDDLPVLGASYLLPPYDACEAENLGYWDDFYQIYFAHLSNDVCQSYIASMLSSLVQGRTVYCYVPEDEMILEFFPAFMMYCEDTFGLTIGTQEQKCMFNTRYADRVRDLIQHYGYISQEELDANFPPSLLTEQKEEDNCPWTVVIPPDAI